MRRASFLPHVRYWNVEGVFGLSETYNLYLTYFVKLIQQKLIIVTLLCKETLHIIVNTGFFTWWGDLFAHLFSGKVRT